MSSTDKIESLTPEQEAKQAEYREEWLKHGFSTEPADFDKAEGIVKELYVQSGHDEPVVVRAPSPVMANFIACLINVLERRSGKDSQVTG